MDPTAQRADETSLTDHAVGPEDAPVTVIEYGDFECPVCAAVEPGLRMLRDHYGDRIRFIFRHFPLEDAHPHALMAAEATEAAAAQGAFWPMHDRLLASPAAPLRRTDLERHAAELGLDVARFVAELDDDIYRQRVREHQNVGRRSHIRATPAFYVEGRAVDVSGGLAPLSAAIDAALKAYAPRQARRH